MSPTAGGIVTSLQVQRRLYLLRQIPNDDDTNHHKSTLSHLNLFASPLVPLVRPDGQPINYHVFPLSTFFCVPSSLPLVPFFGPNIFIPPTCFPWCTLHTPLQGKWPNPLPLRMNGPPMRRIGRDGWTVDSCWVNLSYSPIHTVMGQFWVKEKGTLGTLR